MSTTHSCVSYVCMLLCGDVFLHSPFLVCQEASFEYLQNEGERTLLEAMDALEVALSHPLVSKPLVVN